MSLLWRSLAWTAVVGEGLQVSGVRVSHPDVAVVALRWVVVKRIRELHVRLAGLRHGYLACCVCLRRAGQDFNVMLG